MFVLLTLSKEHPLLAAAENQPLDMQAMSLLVHNAVKANFPDTIDPAGKVNFNWVTNRKQHNHVQFLVQLPSVAVDALLMITAMGPFPEAERQEFLEELLNGKDISSLVMNPAVSVTYKYHYEIMGTIGDKIIGDIGASLLRGETGQDDDVFCMFYPVADTVVFDQFSKQENLDNWTLTRGSTLSKPAAEVEAKPLVNFEELLPVPEAFGTPFAVIVFTAADFNTEHGFDGAPAKFYKHTGTALELVATDEQSLIAAFGDQSGEVMDFLTHCYIHSGDTDYAWWAVSADAPVEEHLGPGSYLLFAKGAVQAVKYVGDDRKDVKYEMVYMALPTEFGVINENLSA